LVQNFKILGKASGCIHDLAGSITNKSAVFQSFKYFSKKSSTFALTKLMLSKLFNLAFFSQSLLADVTNSTEITSFAQAFANTIHIVQVQPYKSRTVILEKSLLLLPLDLREGWDGIFSCHFA